MRDSNKLQILSAPFGATIMGFNLINVAEVGFSTQIEKVPLSRSFVLGVTNLRGAILPVISLARLMGVEFEIKNGAHHVVTHYLGRRIIFEIPQVGHILNIARSEIEKIDTQNGFASNRNFSGLFQNDGRIVKLINIESVFDQLYGGQA